MPHLFKLGLANANNALDAAITTRDTSEDPKVKITEQVKIDRLNKEIPAFEARIQAIEAENAALLAVFTREESRKNILAAIIQQFDGFASTPIKTADGAPAPPLVAVLEAERTVALLGSGGYLLEISPNFAGSTRRIKRNFFLDLFVPTGRITYNGATTIRYSLYQSDGSLQQACSVKTFINFHRAKNAPKATPVINTCRL